MTGDQAVAGLAGFPLTSAQRAGVAAEVRIMAADGVLYDDYGAEVVDFLDRQFP